MRLPELHKVARTKLAYGVIAVVTSLVFFAGCTKAVITVTTNTPPPQGVAPATSSTTQNLAASGASGGTATVSGLRIKFTIGYVQSGPEQNVSGLRIRSTSAGVAHE